MKASQIGVEVSRQEFVDFLNSVKPGQFFHIKGYVNEEGEKADFWLRFGIKYGNIKARDVRLLEGVLAGQQHPDLAVKHNVWIPPAMLNGSLFLNPGEHPVHVTVDYEGTMPDGTKVKVRQDGFANLLDVETFSNRKGNKNDGYNVAATLTYSLPPTHPLVVAAIGAADLQGTLLQGLLRPREATSTYDKEAQSAYSMEKDGATRWYIRDVLRVHKVVRVEGDYPFSATLPINGVKKAIQSQWLLTGKYREFILTDGQFESITIEGQAILVDGVEESFYFALPEVLKEEAAAQA